MSPPGGLELGGRPPRGGRALLVVGAVLLVVGLLATGWGIARAVDAHGEIEKAAVARGVVSAGAGEPVRFTTENDELTLYLDFDGVTDNSSVQERATGAVGCEVVGDDGSVLAFAGDRQGSAVTLGSYVSVGSFEVSSGEVRCGYTSRFREAVRLPDEVPYVLTTAGSGGTVSAVLLILGGVTIGLLGSWLGYLGWARQRRAARLRGLAAGA